MSLPIARLTAALAGSYRVERELGQGGMATVYLAHDMKHDRKVAVKVLRPDLAAVIGAERFLSEIRTTANLQHPHILPLHDSGEADGFLFYVMPYVEGVTLRDRITREHQLPVEEAVRVTREVAGALDYAHRRGVIHRDIKPENILLHDGSALVADFGIALAVSTAGTRMTETGMSLGTPHYMSPEQAMGEREITGRSDVYALGCVTYEMLVGEPPFTGPTAQSIIARVMTEEPRALTTQRRTVPPHVEAAVMTALAKLPADRFATAAEFAAALGNPGFTSTAMLHGKGRMASPRSPLARAVGAAPWVLLALTAGLLAWSRLGAHAPAPPAVLRLGLELPPAVAFEDQAGTAMALSPDGTMLVYSGRDSSGAHLFLRAMGRLDPVSIPGTAGALHPSFTPDGRWVSYWLAGKYMRAPATGGVPETVCSLPAEALGAATWIDAHTIVVAHGGSLEQCTLGGSASMLHHFPDSAGQVLWPHALPGGRGVLYTRLSGSTFDLGVYDARRRSARLLGIAGTNPRYVASGHLVYANLDGTIRAVPFDVEHLTVTGEPVLLAEETRVGGGGAAKMALSLSGTMITAVGRSGEQGLELVDRKGVGQRLPVPPARYTVPRFSPDGRQVAVVVGDLATNIWLLDRRQGTLTRLTFDSGASRPAWSPDGRRVVFSRLQGPTADLRVINADGSAPAESLLRVPGVQIFQALFTHDGRTLVARTTTPTARDIWRIPLDSTRALRPLLTSPADEIGVTLSPDSRWMAYVSDESGRQEVYVRPFPGMGARYQVSLDGGVEPVWSGRGNEIFYRNGPLVLSATVRTSPTFEVVSRTALFSSLGYSLGGFEPMYDVAPDGEHFLMIRLSGRSSGLTVILNLFANLQAGRNGGAGPAPQ